MDLSNQDVEALISILKKLIDAPAEVKEPVKKTKATRKKTTNTKTTDVSKNKFRSMPEINMFKSDKAIDKKLHKMPPIPRTRQFNKINIQCRVCGKTESINPSLAESADRYKCNKCSTSAG